MTANHSILYLFGDANRYAGQVYTSPRHTVHFWKYHFDDYLSLAPDGTRHRATPAPLIETVTEAASGRYSAVACDSNDALLLQFTATRMSLALPPFFINDVDMFASARSVARFIAMNYGENAFTPFIANPDNHWMVIQSSRIPQYRALGINPSNIYYMPICRSVLEFVFPGFSDRFYHAATSVKPSPFANSIVAAGTHNRDFTTFAAALESAGISGDIITNTSLVTPFPSPATRWHGSLPEHEYFAALAQARAVVVPLASDDRASGQLACALPMMASNIVIASDCTSVADHITDGLTGLTFSLRDSTSLRDALLKLDDISLTENIRTAARTRMESLSLGADAEIARFFDAVNLR